MDRSRSRVIEGDGWKPKDGRRTTGERGEGEGAEEGEVYEKGE